MGESKSQFKIGDKVICINESFSVKERQIMFMNFPKKGEVYTIRGFCSLGISMWLEEIINTPLPQRNEIWFYNWHFTKTPKPLASSFKLSKSLSKELINS